MYTANCNDDFREMLERGETKSVSWNDIIKKEYDSDFRSYKKDRDSVLYDLLWGNSDSNHQFASIIKNNYNVKDSDKVTTLITGKRIKKAWIIGEYVYIGSGSKVTRFKNKKG